MADRLCFLAYANTDLKGRSNRGLAEIIALSLSGGIRLPNNSFSNEVITACQYLCMAGVQIPSLYEPGTVIAVKRFLVSTNRPITESTHV